jgi:paraquat-inducible protein A
MSVGRKSSRNGLAVLLVALLVPVLAADVWCAIRIHRLTRERVAIKTHYSDVNGIAHGLLSVEAWMDHVRTIVVHRIDRFTLSKQQEKALQAEISKGMETLIADADRLLAPDDDTVKGKIRRVAVRALLDKEALRKKVPELSRAVLDELSKPTTRKRLAQLAKEKVDEYAAQSRDRVTDHAHLDQLFALYHVADARGFNEVALQRMAALQEETYRMSYVILASLLPFLLAWWPVRRRPALQKPLFTLSLLLAFLVLAVGLTSPMMEIDARIKHLDLLLLGEHLQFENQVLYFRSKSILQVVDLLLKIGRPDSIAVGALILAFSILFPISKLICTEIHLLGGERLKRNKLIHFLAFDSGKWSMADVMVVAIFMAFIGIRAILDNQLASLNLKTDSLSSITTDDTSLQPGFVLFTAFVLYGLALSEILKRTTPAVRS